MKVIADKIDGDPDRYRDAMELIVTDDAIQGGAATFRGTRILAHHFADLQARGVGEASYSRTTRASRLG